VRPRTVAAQLACVLLAACVAPGRVAPSPADREQALPFSTQAQALAAVQPRAHHRRLAVKGGFSLHADTWVPLTDTASSG